MSIEIDKNIPIPKSGTGAKFKKYPYAEMEVGDSYWCDGKGGINAPYIWVARNQNGRKFKSRKENNGYRVWRVR